MTPEDCIALERVAEDHPSGLVYLFWCYPDAGSPLSTQQLMRWRSMPCTPSGDVIADVTGMTLDEAVGIVRGYNDRL